MFTLKDAWFQRTLDWTSQFCSDSAARCVAPTDSSDAELDSSLLGPALHFVRRPGSAGTRSVAARASSRSPCRRMKLSTALSALARLVCSSHTSCIKQTGELILAACLELSALALQFRLARPQRLHCAGAQQQRRCVLQAVSDPPSTDQVC